jgi:hypothetical protein
MKREPTTDDLATTKYLQHAVETGRPMMVPGTTEPRRLARPPDAFTDGATRSAVLPAPTPPAALRASDPLMAAAAPPDPWLRQHPSLFDPLQLALQRTTEWFIRQVKGAP